MPILNPDTSYLGNFATLQRVEYEASLKIKRDMTNVLRTARMMAYDKGFKDGFLDGFLEGFKKVSKKAYTSKP